MAEGGNDAGGAPAKHPVACVAPLVEGDMGAALVDAMVPMLTGATSSPQQCHFGLWVGWGELQFGSPPNLYGVQVRRFPGAAMRARRSVRRLETRWRRLAAPVYDFVEACAIQPCPGGRNMLLFDGPIEAVRTIGSPVSVDGSISRRGPQWWWPPDRRWFVATEIDYPWTYVAGPAPLVQSIVANPALEVVPVRHGDLW